MKPNVPIWNTPNSLEKKMKNAPKEKRVKQEGTSDLGTFLRELSERVHRVPRKLMKHYAQDTKTGYIWRNILHNEPRARK